MIFIKKKKKKKERKKEKDRWMYEWKDVPLYTKWFPDCN